MFAPTCLIVACSVTSPGCMHDSPCGEQGGEYANLQHMYEMTGEKSVVDSAFSRASYPFLRKSCENTSFYVLSCYMVMYHLFLKVLSWA
jgi:hypothetical protein